MELIEKIKQLQNFLESNEKLSHIIKSTDKPINIDFMDIAEYEPEMATELLDNPTDVLKEFEKAVEMLNEISQTRKIHIANLEKIPSCCIRARDIRVNDYGKLKVITGIIRNISKIYPQIISRKFECPSCGSVINVLQPRFENKREPSRCGCGRKGKFKEIDSEKIDAQKIVIEEDLETIEGNQQPNKIDVILEYDLCSEEIERFNTLGSRVSITGILQTKPRIVNGKVTNELDNYIEANFIKQLDDKYKEIKINDDDIKKIKELSKRKYLLNIFVQNFAPYIAGYEEVKKAIILQMFGGVSRTIKGNKQRGDFHILMVGDPSTGKTKLAKATEMIALKYRYVSGVRSTKAGMTVTLTKDDFSNSWGIEAGAVVLANRGICILDEFDKMNPDDRDALHEAMEEQTITLDKANIHTRLVAKTSILACANWKDSRYNKHEDIYKQINMPESLISRFDLYFVFIDIPDEKQDRIIIRKVLRGYDDSEKEFEIDYEFWKKYIIYTKNFEPKLSNEIEKFIEDEFVKVRISYGKQIESNISVIPITHRQGDAFRRLSEASARMHLRDVTMEDVELAKELITNSLKSVALDLDTMKVDIDRIEIGRSSKEQNILWRLRENINQLEKQFGKAVPIDEIMRIFPNEDLDKAEEQLERLKRSGEIYEPRRGFIAKL